MNIEELKKIWKLEEQNAKIHGWDFSHIHGRYAEEDDLPWDYKQVVNKYRKNGDKLLDIDTGGGEFLLTLGHDYMLTSATEGYPPNAELCRKTLTPLGIRIEEVTDYSTLPFESDEFDLVINRHGNYDVRELYRILKPGGLFITQQVGEDNDRELVEMLMPGTPKAFSGLNLKEQKSLFEENGFQVLEQEEAFRPIRFYDVGALVWFARIIEWEFPGFSVDLYWEQLLKVQQKLDQTGVVEGLIHRYLIAARKE